MKNKFLYVYILVLIIGNGVIALGQTPTSNFERKIMPETHPYVPISGQTKVAGSHGFKLCMESVSTLLTSDGIDTKPFKILGGHYAFSSDKASIELGLDFGIDHVQFDDENALFLTNGRVEGVFNRMKYSAFTAGFLYQSSRGEYFNPFLALQISFFGLEQGGNSLSGDMWQLKAGPTIKHNKVTFQPYMGYHFTTIKQAKISGVEHKLDDPITGSGLIFGIDILIQ